MDARTIVKNLHGPAHLAEQLSALSPMPISDEAVQKWCERGAIPTRWHNRIVKVAKAEKVPLTHDDLERLGNGA